MIFKGEVGARILTVQAWVSTFFSHFKRLLSPEAALTEQELRKKQEVFSHDERQFTDMSCVFTDAPHRSDYVHHPLPFTGSHRSP
jgi:hypothetical protein